MITLKLTYKTGAQTGMGYTSEEQARAIEDARRYFGLQEVIHSAEVTAEDGVTVVFRKDEDGETILREAGGVPFLKRRLKHLRSRSKPGEAKWFSLPLLGAITYEQAKEVAEAEGFEARSTEEGWIDVYPKESEEQS